MNMIIIYGPQYIIYDASVIIFFSCCICVVVFQQNSETNVSSAFR
jgi:hypothetical protein